eukprot:4055636-Amphidinium_carterae.1
MEEGWEDMIRRTAVMCQVSEESLDFLLAGLRPSYETPVSEVQKEMYLRLFTEIDSWDVFCRTMLQIQPWNMGVLGMASFVSQYKGAVAADAKNHSLRMTKLESVGHGLTEPSTLVMSMTWDNALSSNLFNDCQ